MALQTGEITNQQKVVLAILGVVGLFMFYSKVYAPMGEKIKLEQKDLEKKEASLVDMKRKAQQLPMLEKEHKMLEAHLKEVEKKLPKSKELPDFLRTITNTAAQFNMEVKTLQVGASAEKEFYRMHPYGMQLQSDYHTLGLFFTKVGKLERIFNIRDLKLSKTIVDGKEKLAANFMLVTYTAK